MDKLYGSYLRVVFEGEVYFVLGSGHVSIPPSEQCEHTVVIPTLYLTKVENTTHLKTPIKVLEAYICECHPLVSEIQAWIDRISVLE